MILVRNCILFISFMNRFFDFVLFILVAKTNAQPREMCQDCSFMDFKVSINFILGILLTVPSEK